MLASHRGHVVAELADGRLVSANFNPNSVWDPGVPGIELATYTGHTETPSRVLAVLAPSDGRVASASGNEVHVWDPADHAPVADAGSGS